MATSSERAQKNTSPAKPFDLKAAIAAKLSADGDRVAMDVYGVTIDVKSMALWSEAEINETQIMGAFEVLKYAFGEENVQKLRDAVKAAGEELTILHARLLMEEFQRRSGLGRPGE